MVLKRRHKRECSSFYFLCTSLYAFVVLFPTFSFTKHYFVINNLHINLTLSSINQTRINCLWPLANSFFYDQVITKCWVNDEGPHFIIVNMDPTNWMANPSAYRSLWELYTRQQIKDWSREHHVPHDRHYTSSLWWLVEACVGHANMGMQELEARIQLHIDSLLLCCPPLNSSISGGKNTGTGNITLYNTLAE